MTPAGRVAARPAGRGVSQSRDASVGSIPSHRRSTKYMAASILFTTRIGMYEMLQDSG